MENWWKLSLNYIQIVLSVPLFDSVKEVILCPYGFYLNDWFVRIYLRTLHWPIEFMVIAQIVGILFLCEVAERFCSRLHIMGSWVQILLQARFFWNLNDASLHRALHVHPSIVLIWLKYCWKGWKAPNHQNQNCILVVRTTIIHQDQDQGDKCVALTREVNLTTPSSAPSQQRR